LSISLFLNFIENQGRAKIAANVRVQATLAAGKFGEARAPRAAK